MTPAMKVTFTEDDGNEVEWDFDPKSVSVEDAERVETAFRDTWDQFYLSIIKGGARARRTLVWYLRTREHPSLRFDDMPSFKLGQLKVELIRDELLELRAQLEGSRIGQADKDAALAWIDDELAQRPEPEHGTAPVGKASRPGGSSTRSRSRAT